MTQEALSDEARQAREDEHTIRRIEAFSDIVIGFCLAEVGVSLSIPNRGTTLTDLGGNVSIFIASFMLVVMLWWNHHRLFKTYLVLSKATIVMNFALLGCLVLMLYFLQVGMRDVTMQGAGQHPFMFLSLLSFAFVYALLAAMLAIGVRARRTSLSQKDLFWGFRRMVSMFMVSATLAIVAVALTVARGDVNVGGQHVPWAEAIIIVMVLWLSMFRRWVLPHVMRLQGIHL